MSANTWHSVEAPCGWRKGSFDMRIVSCPRSKRIDFVATRGRDLSLPRERAGKRWRIWECACGAKHTFVAWKNHRGRRMYSITSLDWAKKHAACDAGTLSKVAVRVRRVR